MLKFIIVVLAAATLCNGDNKVNALRRTLLTTTAMPVANMIKPDTPQITDPDYWDNDDFVPYKTSRHDEFDWKLIKAVMLRDTSNVMFSPFSIKLLLALLGEAAGRDTSTHKELASILPNIQSAIQARELYGKIFGSLLTKSDNYELNIGTKIYVDNFIDPRQRYASIVESYYFTKIEKIDFHKSALAADLINNWCSEITHNHIKELVTKDDIDQSVIVLLNAIYFNGLWRRPFPENETVQLPFFVTPTTQVKTTYMTQTADFYFLESQLFDAKMLRIPYKGRKFAMTIILPDAKAGLDELIHQMESTTVHRAQWLMDEVEVRVQLPKFKFDYTTDFNDILKGFGITQIFTSEASLPALARGSAVENRLQVSKILQKAGVSVTERGTEAFAATEIILTNKFGGDNTREFIANRPFVFLIEDETTGTILFAGKVTNPESFTV